MKYLFILFITSFILSSCNNNPWVTVCPCTVTSVSLDVNDSTYKIGVVGDDNEGFYYWSKEERRIGDIVY